MPFSKVYPLYVQKVEKKGRTQEEVNEIIFWMMGFDEAYLAGKGLKSNNGGINEKSN